MTENFIIKRGQAFSCVCPDGAVFETAREQLALYLGKINGSRLCADPGAPTVYMTVDPTLKNDGFRIACEGERLTLTGGNGRGVLYAVYGLCETLGCHFYAHDTEVVPRLDGIFLPDGFLREETSPFEYRDLYWVGTKDTETAVKLRINGSGLEPGKHVRFLDGAWGGGIGYAGPHFVHTFERLLPGDVWFESHPEYFALIDGKRTAKYLYSQPCLTNPDVLRIMTGGILEWLRQQPDARIVSLSQNDSFVYKSFCECPACRAVNEAEGSPAGTLIRFVNAVAEAIEPEFPDVAVDTLAYQYSVVPPKITKPRHNVIVRMCTGGCTSHPIADCQNNAGPANAIRGWSAICDRLYIWDYTTDFAQYLIPYPNFETLGPNARFFRDNHVKGVFEQGNYNAGLSGEFGELRAYLLANLLWNPDFDTEAGTRDFLDAYYGGGAPYIAEYLGFIREKVRDTHINLVITATNLWGDRISDAECAMLDRLWARAYDAAKNGGDVPDGIPASLCAGHVERSGLCHRWFKLDAKRGEFADPDTFEETASAFYADCRRLGVTNLSEGSNIPWVEVN